MGSIALVITTRDNRDALAASLARATALPDAAEIVVVDNASSDGTAEMVAREFPGVELVRLRGNAGGAARNAGAERTSCDYLAFCRDDAAWTPGSLTRARQILDEYPRVGVLSARVLAGRGQTLHRECRMMESAPRDLYPVGKPILYFMADACVLRRGAFFNCGGYDPRLHAGAEETLLALDMASRGYLIRYSDELTIEQEGAEEAAQALKNRTTTLRNQLWIAWMRHSSAAAWRSTVNVVARCPRDGVARRAFVRALAGIPWVVRERRPVNSRLQRQIDSYGFAPLAAERLEA